MACVQRTNQCGKGSGSFLHRNRWASKQDGLDGVMSQQMMLLLFHGLVPVLKLTFHHGAGLALSMERPKVAMVHVVADWRVHWIEHGSSVAGCSQGHICFLEGKVGQEETLFLWRDPDLPETECGLWE